MAKYTSLLLIFLSLAQGIFSLHVSSEDFYNEGPIAHPNKMPEFLVSDIPEGTESLALIGEDIDADHFLHLVLYNIPPNQKEIAEGGLFSYGMNGWGDFSWGELKPPNGERHHYIFTVYALDYPPNLPNHLSRSELMGAIKNHIIKKTEMVGYYELNNLQDTH